MRDKTPPHTCRISGRSLSRPLVSQHFCTQATTSRPPPAPPPQPACRLPRISLPFTRQLSLDLNPAHIPRIDGRAQAHQRLHRLDPVIVCSRVQGRSSLRRARRVGSSEARGEGHPTAEQERHTKLAGWSRDSPPLPAYPCLPPPDTLPPPRASRPGDSSSSGAATRAPRHPDQPPHSRAVRAVDGGGGERGGAGPDGRRVARAVSSESMKRFFAHVRHAVWPANTSGYITALLRADCVCLIQEFEFTLL